MNKIKGITDTEWNVGICYNCIVFFTKSKQTNKQTNKNKTNELYNNVCKI